MFRSKTLSWTLEAVLGEECASDVEASSVPADDETESLLPNMGPEGASVVGSALLIYSLLVIVLAVVSNSNVSELLHLSGLSTKWLGAPLISTSSNLEFLMNSPIGALTHSPSAS